MQRLEEGAGSSVAAMLVLGIETPSLDDQSGLLTTELSLQPIYTFVINRLKTRQRGGGNVLDTSFISFCFLSVDT